MCSGLRPIQSRTPGTCVVNPGWSPPGERRSHAPTRPDTSVIITRAVGAPSARSQHTFAISDSDTASCSGSFAKRTVRANGPSNTMPLPSTAVAGWPDMPSRKSGRCAPSVGCAAATPCAATSSPRRGSASST
jgi:hypothetical protein